MCDTDPWSEDHDEIPEDPPEPPKTLKIYTEGQALHNGKPTAKAGIGVWFGSQDSRNISEPLPGDRQTNKRAELAAVLRAIELAPDDAHVVISTRSEYAVKCVTIWHKKWIENSWFNSLRKEVANMDVVRRILEKVKEREEVGGKAGFLWVAGKVGDDGDGGSKEAFKLAVEGAKMGRGEDGEEGGSAGGGEAGLAGGGGGGGKVKGLGWK